MYNDDFAYVSDKLSLTETEKLELYPLIEEILNHDMWNIMANFQHHLDTCSVHSLEVCCIAWRKAKKSKNCDAEVVAVGALLHDFFLYDWQNDKYDFELLDIKLKAYLPKAHGFSHPSIALNNAYKYFPQLMNDKVADIIVKHMWPLTIASPKYKESWIVCMADKKCSLNVLKHPSELPKFVGIKQKKKLR